MGGGSVLLMGADSSPFLFLEVHMSEKSQTIALRVTPSEHSFVVSEAKKFGCTSSALIRALIKIHFDSRKHQGDLAQRVERHLETPHD